MKRICQKPYFYISVFLGESDGKSAALAYIPLDDGQLRITVSTERDVGWEKSSEREGCERESCQKRNCEKSRRRNKKQLEQNSRSEKKLLHSSRNWSSSQSVNHRSMQITSFVLDGLEPDCVYRVVCEKADCKRISGHKHFIDCFPEVATLYFRTPPIDPKKGLLRPINIATVSCNNRFTSKTNAWETLALASERVDLCINLGDAIYTDIFVREAFNTLHNVPVEDWEKLREVIRRRFLKEWRTVLHEEPYQARFMRTVPQLFILDDHEIMDNYFSREDKVCMERFIGEIALTIWKQWKAALQLPKYYKQNGAGYGFYRVYGDTMLYFMDRLKLKLNDDRQLEVLRKIMDEYQYCVRTLLLCTATVPVRNAPNFVSKWVFGDSDPGSYDAFYHYLFHWMCQHPYNRAMIVCGDIHVGMAGAVRCKNAHLNRAIRKLRKDTHLPGLSCDALIPLVSCGPVRNIPDYQHSEDEFCIAESCYSFSPSIMIKERNFGLIWLDSPRSSLFETCVDEKEAKDNLYHFGDKGKHVWLAYQRKLVSRYRHGTKLLPEPLPKKPCDPTFYVMKAEDKHIGLALIAPERNTYLKDTFNTFVWVYKTSLTDATMEINEGGIK